MRFISRRRVTSPSFTLNYQSIYEYTYAYQEFNMPEFEKIDLQALIRSPALEIMLKKCKISTSKYGSFLYGCRIPEPMSSYGIIQPKGGIIIPDHSPDELQNLRLSIPDHITQGSTDLNNYVDAFRSENVDYIIKIINEIRPPHTDEAPRMPIWMAFPSIRDTLSYEDKKIDDLRMSIAFKFNNKTYQWTPDSIMKLEADLHSLK
jgi:hypothetical protein